MQPPSGVVPFEPLAGPNPGSFANPMAQRRSGGLYGMAGGLKGGGLGMALDPTSDQKSDPITTLIKALLGGR